MNHHILAAALSLLGWAPIAHTDPRIKTVSYDPEEVVSVPGQTGIQSVIEFAPDEHIENVAIGNSLAWQITPNKRASLLFIKPLTATGRTNMAVITDRRKYMFDLVPARSGAPPLYALRFSFPQSDELERPKLAESIVAQMPKPAPAGGHRINFRWKSKGSSRLTPARVFDDGAALYLSWDSRKPQPNFLTALPDGREAPLASEVNGPYVVIRPIPGNLLLRHGNRLVTIHPDLGSHFPEPPPVAASFSPHLLSQDKSAPPSSATEVQPPLDLTSLASTALTIDRQNPTNDPAEIEPHLELQSSSSRNLRIPYPPSLYNDALAGGDDE